MVPALPTALWLAVTVWAAPLEEHLEEEAVVVRLAPRQPLPWGLAGRWSDALSPLLSRASPRPLVHPETVARLPAGDALSRYALVRTADPGALVEVLSREPSVELAYRPQVPAPPPGRDWSPDHDLPPRTPDFDHRATWKRPAPRGLDLEEAAWWPGGDGGAVAIADVEYAWDPHHEDLSASPPLRLWGTANAEWAFHGNAVLGVLGATSDGFGFTGGAPGASLWVVHPLDEGGSWVVASAVAEAAAALSPGDVLLLEQQAWGDEGYAPITSDPAVFDAVTVAVAAGIVVVEPSANGASDLDDPRWEAWFDRAERDSGSIMVGGGVPGMEEHPRSHAGGNHGSRVDVQGWYRGIPSPTSRGHSPDLFFPFGDYRQAYTSQFGGTSGAAAQVAAAAAVVQSISLTLHGEPVEPTVLRGWLASTGQPPPAWEPKRLGPLPDLRALIRTFLAT